MSETQESEMANNINRLKAKRAGHRGVVTKLANEALEYLTTEEQIVEPMLSRLEIIDGQLKTKLKVLEEIDQQVLNVCEIEAIENEIEESEEILAKILECRKRIEKGTRGKQELQPQPQVLPNLHLQAQTSQVQQQPSPQVVSDQNVNTTSSHVFPTIIRTRLPKLTLPKFKGNVTNWTTFWDSFQSAVDQNKDITDIDKFNYLNSLLEGAASRAVKGLTISEANYKSAIEILKERFGKPQQVISAHMDELMKIQPCQNERPSTLRFIYDKISVHVRGLSSLGVSSEQYGSLLIPIIMSKLPTEIRLLIARKSSKDVWEIDELLETIKNEVEAREASDVVKINEVRRQNYGENNSRRQGTPSTMALTTRSSAENIRCVYCNGSHYSASCEKIVHTKDRKEILFKEGRCFNCIKKGHYTKSCQNAKSCRHCGGRHHQSICAPKTETKDGKTKQETRVEENPASPEKTESTVVAKVTTNRDKVERTVLLQTARAFALNENNAKSSPVRILFDSGSQRTYVTSRLSSKLGLKPIKTETLRLNTFGQGNYRKEKCAVVKLRLRKNNEEIDIVALEHPVICSPLPSKVCFNQPHLEGLELADSFDGSPGDIDILVGSDYYWNFVSGEIIRGEDGLTALASNLGWLLSGPLQASEISDDTVVSNLIISADCKQAPNENEVLASELKRFWDVESVGVRECNDKDEEPSNQIIEDIQFNNGRYVLGLPWNQVGRPECNNYELCHNRLRSLHYKLRKQPNILQEYDSIIKSQLESGIIEEIPNQEPKEQVENVHYIPHHAVIRDDKETTKVRIVYDCSAKSPKQDCSLNDCLRTGPNFIPKLFEVLVRFRSNPVGLVADIEKAFLMVGIRHEDRNMLRFLWFKDPNNTRPEVVQLRFCRLVFGLKSSPSMLGGTILHHIDSYKERFPEIVEVIKNSLYVDDLVSGSTNDEEAFNIYDKSKKIMLDAGFNLRKWNSNSKKLMDNIQKAEGAVSQQQQSQPSHPSTAVEEDESYAKYQVGPCSDKDDSVKLLGIAWNITSDDFHFNLSELVNQAKSFPVTKRSLLRLTAKIFDPLGLLSPFTIKMKMMFQVLCIEGVNWDDELTGELQKQYLNFLAELQCINDLRIPRCYFSSNEIPTSIQLHAFCDASEKAIGTAVYMRSTYERGDVKVVLVASKTKVAPIKRQSIPRQELLGAVVLVKLVDTLSKALSMQDVEITYWTDSMTTLFWILNQKEWKQYVQHRVQEIRRLSERSAWRFCPGPLNPADLPSRGIPGHEIIKSTTWWSGPPFLHHPEDKWPTNPIIEKDKAFEELSKNPTSTTHVLATCDGIQTTSCINKVIDCERFGNLLHLLRVSAYVLKAVKLFKQAIVESVQPQARKETVLTADQITEAESCWIKLVQTTAFDKELSYLKGNRTVNEPALVRQFGLFVGDDGIIKCKGRLNHANLPQASKTPILLPSRHRFVYLTIIAVHERVKHSGIRDTLSTIRERFWILRGRESVKKVLRRCVLCRRLEGPPYRPNATPDLPPTRVSDGPPFNHTGMDFAGPLFVKSSKQTDEKEMCQESKVYICLFTCQSTRAVHLELTTGLDAQSFLQAFRRFSSRRGLPSSLMSDNARNFKSSSKEVCKIIRADEVKRYLANNRITWNFIIERAPWWGGFWERLVKSIKRSLKKIIGRASLSFEEMRTVLVETEAVLNARPITYVYDDEESVSYPLTPSHLLNGRRITNMANSEHYEVVSTYKTLTRRARHQKNILQQFTNRWRKEYLIGLREQHKEKVKKEQHPSISVGDIVIVKGDSTQRAFWKLAIVEELISSKDGNVRAAVVKVANSEKKPSILRRAIQHLYPIEVERDIYHQPKEIMAKDSISSETEIKSTRPRRKAAERGELQRRRKDN